MALGRRRFGEVADLQRAALGDHRRALDYEAVAVKLYGEASEANHKRLRSALSSLSHGEKIRAGNAHRVWVAA